MRHRIAGRTFGRRSGPRKALMRGLANSLIDAERITTTVAKAKELRKYVEPLVTLAKRGDLHSRRLAAGQLYRKETVQKLFSDLAVRFKDRAGGYTRILRSNRRQGDGAELALIEFLDRKVETKVEKKPKKKSDKESGKATKDSAKKAEAGSSKSEKKPQAEKKPTKKTTKKAKTAE